MNAEAKEPEGSDRGEAVADGLPQPIERERNLSSSEVTDAALRRSVSEGALRAALHTQCHGLPSFEGICDPEALLTRLDQLRPFSLERDALLADLLRLHRRRTDGAALGVLVYALRSTMVQRFVRAAGASPRRRRARCRGGQRARREPRRVRRRSALAARRCVRGARRP